MKNSCPAITINDNSDDDDDNDDKNDPKTYKYESLIGTITWLKRAKKFGKDKDKDQKESLIL